MAVTITQGAAVRACTGPDIGPSRIASGHWGMASRPELIRFSGRVHGHKTFTRPHPEQGRLNHLAIASASNQPPGRTFVNVCKNEHSAFPERFGPVIRHPSGQQSISEKKLQHFLNRLKQTRLTSDRNISKATSGSTTPSPPFQKRWDWRVQQTSSLWNET
jgi:hypothetical protein